MRIRQSLTVFAVVLLSVNALLLVSVAQAQETEPRNMSFEDPPMDTAGGRPPGWWFVQHAGETSFEFAIDDRVAKDGKRSLRIKRTGKQPFGLVLQKIRADRFRGKRVRLTAFLRLENVEAYGHGALREISGATLMLRSDGSGGGAFDDMRDRPLRGTKPWTEVSVEISVPETATVVEFGATLSGSGTLWVDAVKLEAVVQNGASEATAK
jgi:hypothetical protein